MYLTNIAKTRTKFVKSFLCLTNLWELNIWGIWKISILVNQWELETHNLLYQWDSDTQIQPIRASDTDCTVLYKPMRVKDTDCTVLYQPIRERDIPGGLLHQPTGVKDTDCAVHYQPITARDIRGALLHQPMTVRDTDSAVRCQPIRARDIHVALLHQPMTVRDTDCALFFQQMLHHQPFRAFWKLSYKISKYFPNTLVCVMCMQNKFFNSCSILFTPPGGKRAGGGRERGGGGLYLLCFLFTARFLSHSANISHLTRPLCPIVLY